MKAVTRKSLGFGLIALVPIACCIATPLVLAAGISVAAFAWAGAVAVALVAAAGCSLLLLRRRSNSAGR